MKTLTETLYRTENPLGETMQARDLPFLRLNMRRYMAQQGLEVADYGNWFNPKVEEVQYTYRGRKTTSVVTVATHDRLWPEAPAGKV